MHFKTRIKAQSFIEFALVLPILLLVLLGVVELTLYMGAYINLVDLTREAARFAGRRNGVEPPRLLAAARVVRRDEPSNAVLAAADADHNFVLHDERR